MDSPSQLNLVAEKMMRDIEYDFCQEVATLLYNMIYYLFFMVVIVSY
jgi:hypothetical protein